MAEFCPLKDYFGLNALVSKIVRAEPPSTNSTISGPSMGTSYTDGTSRNDYEGTAGNKLEDFDIIRLSRVYKERLTNVRRRRKPINHCVFCKNNQESEAVYTSHKLKDEQQNITCPILRAYTCPICGANGDGAHTIKYCPYRTNCA